MIERPLSSPFSSQLNQSPERIELFRISQGHKSLRLHHVFLALPWCSKTRTCSYINIPLNKNSVGPPHLSFFGCLDNQWILEGLHLPLSRIKRSQPDNETRCARLKSDLNQSRTIFMSSSDKSFY
ncbi:hypothetical protein ABKN59_000921 [Abortiporus biennis]